MPGVRDTTTRRAPLRLLLGGAAGRDPAASPGGAEDGAAPPRSAAPHSGADRHGAAGAPPSAGARSGADAGAASGERGVAAEASRRRAAGAPPSAGARSAADAGAAPGGECVVSRGAVRAGDRHDPWTLPTSAAVRALAAEAARVGLDPELAVRLTVECALVCDDLRAAGADPAALDAAAAAERVGDEIDPAAAAYLRRLTQCMGTASSPLRPAHPRPPGPPLPPSPPATVPAAEPASSPFPPARELGPVVTFGLPVRLGGRLLHTDLDALLAAAVRGAAPLERALAWEVAAVLAGRTMSEWAPLTALRLRPR